MAKLFGDDVGNLPPMEEAPARRFRWGYEDCTEAAVARPMPPGAPLPALASPECRRSREERVGLAQDGFPAGLHDGPVGEHDPVEVPREDAL